MVTGAALLCALATRATRATAQGVMPPLPPVAPGLPGYTTAGAAAESLAEARVLALPAPTLADSFSRVLSREPHMAGTPAQARTRDYVVTLMRSWGLKTEVRAYDVYMPQPTGVHVWRLGTTAAPDSEELVLDEPVVPGDTTTSSFPQVPTFNAYSGTGNAAGDVVYVNYGLVEDYAHLESVGISVRGRVVIARYGRSFRGIKAREAERHGAAAILIYSDPADDGYVRGDVYPEGPMRPERGVQRGSVMNQTGDPSTPGYPSTSGARRIEPAHSRRPAGVRQRCAAPPRVAGQRGRGAGSTRQRRGQCDAAPAAVAGRPSIPVSHRAGPDTGAGGVRRRHGRQGIPHDLGHVRRGAGGRCARAPRRG